MGTRDTVRDTVINRQPPLPAANPRERDPDLELLGWILELDRNLDWTVFAGLGFTMGTRDTVRDTVINRQPPLPAANPRERDPDLELLGWILELVRLAGSWNLSAWLDPGTCQLGWILELVSLAGSWNLSGTGIGQEQ